MIEVMKLLKVFQKNVNLLINNIIESLEEYQREFYK